MLQLDSIREERQRLTDEESDSDYDETPDISPSGNTSNLYDHHGFILGYRSADVDLKNCHPLPSHVPFLWSVYQENVESLVKLVHVPSIGALLRDTRKDNTALSSGNEALLFSIYFAAIISLEADEVSCTARSTNTSNSLIGTNQLWHKQK